MEPNLAESIYIRSSIKFLHFVPTNMAAKGNSCFWLSNVKKIFSSETAWPNGAKLGSKHLCKVLYKVSPIRSFHQQIWPPRAILVSDWLLFKKIFSSETAWQNGAKLGRKHLCKILYIASSFGSIRPTNMAAKINSFFWLANVKKIFSSETAWPNGA